MSCLKRVIFYCRFTVLAKLSGNSIRCWGSIHITRMPTFDCAALPLSARILSKLPKLSRRALGTYFFNPRAHYFHWNFAVAKWRDQPGDSCSGNITPAQNPMFPSKPTRGLAMIRMKGTGVIFPKLNSQSWASRRTTAQNKEKTATVIFIPVLTKLGKVSGPAQHERDCRHSQT